MVVQFFCNLNQGRSGTDICLPAAANDVCKIFSEEQLVFLVMLGVKILRLPQSSRISVVKLHCHDSGPCIFLQDVLDRRAEVTLKRLLLIQDLPHEHSEGVHVHLRSWIDSLLGLLEALWGGVNTDGAIAKEHVCIALKVAHF